MSQPPNAEPSCERPLRVLFVIGASTSYRQLEGLVDATDPADITWLPFAIDAGDGGLRERLAGRGIELGGAGSTLSWRGVPAATRSFRRAFDRLQPDVVHANLFFPSLAVELARVRRSLPSVASRHHNLQHHHGRPVHRAVDAWVASRATRVIAVSRAVADTLVDREGVPRQKVDVVLNGYDWSRVLATDAGTDAWRRRFDNRRVAVAVGRLDPVKDLDTVIRAFALARRRHPTALLVVAGDGPPSETARLRRLAASLGLDDDAVWFPGYVDDVFDLMSAADVLVQASTDEACPQSISEALGLAVPLAVTTTGGTAEVIAGAYAPLAPGDPSALARHIVLAFDDPGRARRHAAAAAPAARERLSIRRTVDGFLQSYAAAMVDPTARRGRGRHVAAS